MALFHAGGRESVCLPSELLRADLGQQSRAQ